MDGHERRYISRPPGRGYGFQVGAEYSRFRKARESAANGKRTFRPAPLAADQHTSAAVTVKRYRALGAPQGAERPQSLTSAYPVQIVIEVPESARFLPGQEL